MLHLMLDLEALGRRPGCAIIEIGAVAFDSVTGHQGEVFHAHLAPDPRLHQCPETLAWHADQGTWPRPDVHPEEREHPESAILSLYLWASELGDIETVWSWGATYDFPVLAAAAHIIHGQPAPPWEYWRQACARTIWRQAFPDRRHAPRPHHAVEDCRAAIRDLREAQAALSAAPPAPPADAEPSPTPLVFWQAGLRHIADAAILSLLGRCHLSGLTTPQALQSLHLPHTTVREAFARLVAGGLATAPVQDTRRGRPNRYHITPAGQATLATTENIIPASSFQPELIP